MEIVSQCSSESLDIKTILTRSPHNTDRLLATSMSFLSLISSTIPSFTDIPSFPSHEAMPPLFLNVASPTPAFSTNRDHTVTAPTSPRLKAMLMEPIVVNRWAETLADTHADDSALTLEESSVSEPPSWMPEGSLVPPEELKATFHDRRYSNSNMKSIVDVSASEICEIDHSSIQVEVSCVEEGDSTVSTSILGITDGEDGLAVPTIMLSNSTAAMPLTFESSQSLAPLAVRRGHKVPAPLAVGVSNVDDGLYPGIPTPFLGSPSPTGSEHEFNANGPDSSLDFNLMCKDLRSRCPPLQPFSPLTPEPSTRSSTSSLSNSSLDSDTDEWAFAKEILASHGDPIARLDSPLLKTPAKHAPEIPDELRGDRTPEADSYSWSSTPTLTNSPESPDQPSEAVNTLALEDTCKQQRRRTVIIETPRNSVFGNARPARVTIDLSHLADSEDQEMSPKFDEPIPFETLEPGKHYSFTESTPYARPLSSASMRPPVRGILKSREKKCVRFSMLPSMHEYPEDETEPKSSFDADPEPEPEPEKKNKRESRAQGRKRATTEPTPRKEQEPRLRPSSEQGRKTQMSRASFPKHPAVRSFVRGTTPSPTPPSRASNTSAQRSLQHILVPRNVTKTEVGSPKKLLKRATLDSPMSSPPKATKRKITGNEENTRSRTSVTVASSQGASHHKSRMSAPFRSILTKLRA